MHDQRITSHQYHHFKERKIQIMRFLTHQDQVIFFISVSEEGTHALTHTIVERQKERERDQASETDLNKFHMCINFNLFFLSKNEAIALLGFFYSIFVPFKLYYVRCAYSIIHNEPKRMSYSLHTKTDLVLNRRNHI